MLFLACPSANGGPGGDAGPPLPVGEKIDGIITFYDGDGRGACGFDATSDDFTAIGDSGWAGSAACGSCIEVVGPRGQAVVRVVDRCPECGPGHLDLARRTFEKLADPKLGRVGVSWTPVLCPVSGNVRLQFKDGSNPWWTAVQVRNQRRPVTRFEVMKQGAWVAVPRTDYNYFVDPSGFGDGPKEVRLSAENGETLTGTLPAVKAGLEVDFGAQFR